MLPVYLWNEDIYYSFIVNFFTRYIVLLNITWSVNSVAHIYGTRPYDKYVYSAEERSILGVLTQSVSMDLSTGMGWNENQLTCL